MMPKMSRATINSVVITGRRMHSSGSVMAPSLFGSGGWRGGWRSSRWLGHDLGARSQSQLAVGHHGFPGGHALADGRHALVAGDDLQPADFDRVVGLPHVQEIAVGPLLDGLVGYEDGLADLVEHHADVEELAGRQARLLVVEHGLHL